MADESIWDAGDCASYLKMSRKHFLRDIQYREGFPARLPWSMQGQPRWAAQDVKTWALLRQNYATASQVLES